MDELTKELFPRFKEVPLLSHLNDKQLELVATQGRLFVAAPNQVICNEGDFDETVFVNLGGLVKITKQDPTTGEERYIAALGQNEFFGEQSAVSGQARAANIVAETKTYFLEIGRDVFLDMMKKNKTFKAYVDKIYFDRALWGHLKLIPAFADMPNSALAAIASIAKLESYARNQVVAQEGEAAEKLFLVRQGYLKVSVYRRGKDDVYAYLRDNNYFGEESLFGSQKYSATVTSLSPTEAVVLTKADFDGIKASHPELQTAIQTFMEDKLSVTREDQDVDASTGEDIMVKKGFVATRALLILDTRKCVRCEICVRSCAATHQGNSRIHLTGYTVENWLLPTACFQCRDPECQLACRFGCISRNLNGQIFINEGLCTGCSACSKACPYGSIIMNPPPSATQHGFFAKLFAKILGRELVDDHLESWREQTLEKGKATQQQLDRGIKAKNKATKCDLCVGYGFTSCVYNCPTGALNRVNPELFFSERTQHGDF